MPLFANSRQKARRFVSSAVLMPRHKRSNGASRLSVGSGRRAYVETPAVRGGNNPPDCLDGLYTANGTGLR